MSRLVEPNKFLDSCPAGKSIVYVRVNGKANIFTEIFDSVEDAFSKLVKEMNENDYPEGALNSVSEDGEYLDVIVFNRYKKRKPFSFGDIFKGLFGGRKNE